MRSCAGRHGAWHTLDFELSRRSFRLPGTLRPQVSRCSAGSILNPYRCDLRGGELWKMP